MRIRLHFYVTQRLLFKSLKRILKYLRLSMYQIIFEIIILCLMLDVEKDNVEDIIISLVGSH